ncbi:MAG TPA: hypothetical protein VFR88_11355 [Microlunatus sp.]|nr:hypothetical protein [Microlunatus sp.]
MRSPAADQCAISSGSGPIDEQYRPPSRRSVSLAIGPGYRAGPLAVLIAVTWLPFRRRDVS